jgi:CRP-like cAMP-binding protein
MTKYKNNNNIEKLDISEELWEIYKRPPESRTQNNINYLYQESKKLKCFKNILTKNEKGQLMVRELLSRVEFSLFHKGKNIYSFNEPIINMFFIFEGEVIIYKKNPLTSSKIKKLNKEQTIKEIDYYLSKGDEYGKEDLKKEKREVIVESNSKCIIGFLTIQDWTLIFEKTNILEKNDIINFISKINMFKDMNHLILNNLCDIIKMKKVSKSAFLVKKGEPYKNIYIIRYGSFKIFFNSKIKITTEFDLNSFSDSKKRSQSANIKYKFEKNCFDKLQYQIIYLFNGEFIGDIEYYLGKEKYVLFAKCSSDDTEVIEISLQNFESICSRRMKAIFLKEIKNKIDYFEKRCKEIKKVHKNKNFGLKNRYKLMIIRNIEEQNKNEFEKMENKAKYRNQSNDKKLNTVIANFRQKPNLFLTDTNENNNTALSILFDKINQFRKKSILIRNNINSTNITNFSNNTNSNINNHYNSIMRRNSNKYPMTFHYSGSSKKASNKILNSKKKSIFKDIYDKVEMLSEQKKPKNIRFLNNNLNEIINNNNITTRNKSLTISNNFRIKKNSNSILIENSIYNHRNMESFPDINKNFLVNHNSREIRKNLNTIFYIKNKKI